MSVRSDGERLKLCLPTAHFLLCGPVPNRPLMDRSAAPGFGDPCSYGRPCGYDLFRKWGLSRWTQGEVIVEWGDLSEEGRLETDTKEGRLRGDIESAGRGGDSSQDFTPRGLEEGTGPPSPRASEVCLLTLSFQTCVSSLGGDEFLLHEPTQTVLGNQHSSAEFPVWSRRQRDRQTDSQYSRKHQESSGMGGGVQDACSSLGVKERFLEEGRLG